MLFNIIHKKVAAIYSVITSSIAHRVLRPNLERNTRQIRMVIVDIFVSRSFVLGHSGGAHENFSYILHLELSP